MKTRRTIALSDTPGAEAVALWRACLTAALESPSWPDTSFEPGSGYLARKRAFAERVSLRTRRTYGEIGLSLFLKSVLFDNLSEVVYQYYGDDVSVNWQAIDKHSSGATDWGFFVNDELKIIVELKPTEVCRRGLRLPS